jgi:hypothetical protein
MDVEALKQFVLTQGASKATNLMEWDKIWSMNKQIIDPKIPRYSAIGTTTDSADALIDVKSPFPKVKKMALVDLVDKTGEVCSAS